MKPSIARVLRRHPEETAEYLAGGDLDEDLMDDLYDYYVANGDVPDEVQRDDPTEWVCQQLDSELGC